MLSRYIPDSSLYTKHTNKQIVHHKARQVAV